MQERVRLDTSWIPPEEILCRSLSAWTPPEELPIGWDSPEWNATCCWQPLERTGALTLETWCDGHIQRIQSLESRGLES